MAKRAGCATKHLPQRRASSHVAAPLRSGRDDTTSLPQRRSTRLHNNNTRMTTYFITRHPGALEWAQRQGLAVDTHVNHLDTSQISAGDTVIGTLPVNLAADVCARGARYLHLSLNLPAAARGRELEADELDAFGARLEAFAIKRKQP